MGPACSVPGLIVRGVRLVSRLRKVRSALNIRFQGTTPPRMLFTDRGNGFYNAGTGRITETYRKALRTHGLQAFFATDASA